jgi:hypothetical protein
LASELLWSWRAQLAQVDRTFWANRKRPFCQHNCPQIPYWAASKFRWITDGDTSHCEWRRSLNLTPANLSLQCDSPGQSKPRLQTSSPAVAGAISPSIIDVHFRYGVVLNSHSTRICGIGWLCLSEQSRQTSRRCLEAVAIATHTRSQQRLLEGLKSAAEVAAIHRLERRGKPKGNVVPSPVYEHPELASNITRNSSGFRVLDRLVIHDNCAQTITCSRTSARILLFGSDGCQLVLRGTRIAALKSLPR